jgi:hypothetical protein
VPVFKQLGALLPHAVSRMKIKRPIEATFVCRAADEALGLTFEHQVPMRAVRFKDGTVVVAVMSAGWGQEVRGRAEQLKTDINKKLRSKQVADIRTLVDPSRADPEELV